MAAYDYFCLQCEVAEEVQRPMHENEPEDGHLCPRCGYRMIKQFTLPAVRFVGPGFYSTDSKR